VRRANRQVANEAARAFDLVHLHHKDAVCRTVRRSTTARTACDTEHGTMARIGAAVCRVARTVFAPRGRL
jgi:hypothetical protein